MATKISIRQQLEGALYSWLSASFSAASEFSGVTFCKGQQSGEVTMPLISAACEDASEEEYPGLGIYRVPAAIIVMTTIDETTADAAHRARADLIANRAEDLDGLKSHLNGAGMIYVFGFGVFKSSHSVGDRHFVDRFELDVHCRCT
jgi:hypothetical protein